MTFRAERATLLIIDVQNAIDADYHSIEGPRNHPDAERTIVKLIEKWRHSGDPIIHIRHDSTSEHSAYRPGQPGNDFKPAVAPAPGELVIAKQTNSAFIGTDLEARLKAIGTMAIVVCGVSTNNSVETTVRMAANLGFRVVVVDDACFCFGKRDWNGTPRTAAEVHAMSLANLSGEYCEVVRSNAL
ncbi:MAG: cysteine hydrolase family protein [Terricaulis sp.]